MKWYNGPTLIHQLENVKLLKSEEEFNDYFMPVLWVNRPNQNFRGFSGKVECGTLRPGDIVRVLPSNKTFHSWGHQKGIFEIRPSALVVHCEYIMQQAQVP